MYITLVHALIATWIMQSATLNDGLPGAALFKQGADVVYTGTTRVASIEAWTPLH